MICLTLLVDIVCIHIQIYIYHIEGKFGKFGKSSLIHQTKTIQISTYNYNQTNLFYQKLKTN